jgi:surface polysaccharide O-acyltransferase-like enzyme
MKKRNSSIELLKIIGMVLIAINHSVPIYGDQNSIAYVNLSSTTNFSTLILILLKSFGHLGNLIFIICSIWFLSDSNKTNIEKIIALITDTFIISILWFIPIIVLKIPISDMDIIKELFPTTFSNNWFITCYILLYAIHPLLNKIINGLSQKELLNYNIYFVILFCILQFIFAEKYYYNNLIGFVALYFIVVYMKKYMKNYQSNINLNIKLILSCILINILMTLSLNFVGLKIPLLSDKTLYFENNMMNPFNIIMIISLFNIYKNKQFNNTKINYISSLSLLFYLIHENRLFANNIKPLFY